MHYLRLLAVLLAIYQLAGLAFVLFTGAPPHSHLLFLGFAVALSVGPPPEWAATLFVVAACFGYILSVAWLLTLHRSLRSVTLAFNFFALLFGFVATSAVSPDGDVRVRTLAALGWATPLMIIALAKDARLLRGPHGPSAA